MLPQAKIHDIGNPKQLRIASPENGEIRILSVDVAVMGSTRHKNDATAIFINAMRPTKSGKFTRNIIYLDNELYQYKNTLMELLCSDPAIVALVMNSEEAECPNRDMPYRHVFPYNYVPDTTKEAMVFVCYDVEIRRVPNKTIFYPDVYVWAFCHKSLMRLPDGGGVRPDKLVCEINHVLSGSPCLGAGPLELAGLSSIAPIDNHWGKLLHYVAVEFNRPSASYGELRGGRRGRYG